MPDLPRKLRQSIALFERLLRECRDPELAAVYHAEIDAARAQLDASDEGASGERRE